MKYRLLAVLIVLAGVTFASGVATAAWIARSDDASVASSRATVLASIDAPSVSSIGTSVSVSWQSTDVPGARYILKRYNDFDVEQTVTGACSGLITELSCNETSVTAGTWRYAVTPVVGEWTGDESVGTTVTVTPPLPGVALTFPSHDTTYSMTTWNNGCASSICGTASSSSGIHDVKVSVRRSNGMYWTGAGFSSAAEVLLTANGTSTWSLPFTASNFGVDDAYVVRVVATDTVSAVNSTTATITLDTTAPSVALSLPSPIRDGHVLTSSATDGGSGVSSVGYEYCTGALCAPNSVIGSSTTPATFALAWSGQPADGTYRVQARATDEVGNVGVSNIATTLIDNTAPTTSDNTAAIGNGWKKTTQTVTLSASDGAGAGVSRTYYTVDGSTPTTASAFGDSIVLSNDGVYTIKYFSLDNAGNAEAVNVAATSIRIDKTSPSASFTMPANIRNGQSLNGSGVDTLSGVASISYLYCSGTSCTPTSSIGSSSVAPFSIIWSSQPANGQYQVLARVTDNAGNVTDSAKQTVRIDNTNPTGSVTAPVNNAIIRNSVALTSSAADSGSGVASVQFQAAVAGTSTWNNISGTTWNTTTWSDGFYNVRVIITDNAGNTFTSASTVSVEVQNAAPTPVTLNLGNNGVAGKVDQGDEIEISFSQTMDIDTICSAWSSSDSQSNQSITSGNAVMVTLVDGGASNDSVTVSASGCSNFNFGSINLGSTQYVTGGNMTFGGSGSNKSTLEWIYATRTLRVTLGKNGGSGTAGVVSTSLATYTPDADMRNMFGLAITGTATRNEQEF